ncbi:MAG: hypothetical protein WAV78_51775, partial [Xanthobacteraceae bacterium]
MMLEYSVKKYLTREISSTATKGPSRDQAWPKPEPSKADLGPAPDLPANRLAADDSKQVVFR